MSIRFKHLILLITYLYSRENVYTHLFPISDIVFVRTWFQVQTPMFYNPVITLLLPPDKRNQWQGMKTVGQLRREKNIKPETRADSLYRVSCIEFIIVLFSYAVSKE